MPLYAYTCDSCGYEFDARRDFEGRDDVGCPECDTPARRQLATIAVTGVTSAADDAGPCGPGMCAMRQEAGLPCSMAN